MRLYTRTVGLQEELRGPSGYTPSGFTLSSERDAK